LGQREWGSRVWALFFFAPFSLVSAVILAGVGAWFLMEHGWSRAAWVALTGVYLGFLVWWPTSSGRLDPDRYLLLGEVRWTLLAFGIVWALFAAASLRAPEHAFTAGRRVGFVTLNNALFLGLGWLTVPPRFPQWHWKLTVLFGLVLLVAGTQAGRWAEVRRGYFVQGGWLVVLGAVSGLTGREGAAMLAVASALCAFTATRRDHWWLRDLAFAAAVLAVAAAWRPIRDDASNGLRLGALVGAVLVFVACWIDGRRALWPRGSVAIFSGLGLALWLATTWCCTPAVHRAPLLALEGVLLTASFATLRVREIPWLGKGFILAAIGVWLVQVGALERPWWNPLVVLLATLGTSLWWQTRGRSLLPAWELRWVQAVAAAGCFIVTLVWIDGRLGAQPAALVAMSALALGGLLYAVAVRDLFLAGFSQLFTVTGIGEFIGQHGDAPLPGGPPALVPIVVLPLLAPIVRGAFAGTEWERPARFVAALYGVLAAAMLVVWALHYIGAGNRFLFLAAVAMALLLWSAVEAPRGPLLASLVCSGGALLVFWLGWNGAHGFRLRDLAAFVLLLGFGVAGRRARLLPAMIQEMGIVLGLASLVHWITLWAPHHFPRLPIAVVWSVVALIILAFGWWLREWLYRGAAWALLAAALGRVWWMDHATPPQFRLGLLAVGLAALVAAFTYMRQPAEAGK
jgi:hypothetical protein